MLGILVVLIPKNKIKLESLSTNVSNFKLHSLKLPKENLGTYRKKQYFQNKIPVIGKRTDD